MTTEDKDKAEVLNAFFMSVFTRRTAYPRSTQPPDLEFWDKEQNKHPTVQVETIKDLLLHLDCYKSMGPDGIHSGMLRELADVISGPFRSSISDYDHQERSQMTGDLLM